MTGTASIWEVAALIVNLGGIAAVLYLIARTHNQYEAVTSEDETDLERMAAWRHFRSEIERIFYHVGSIMLGIWGTMLPDGSSMYGYALMSFRLVLGIIMLVDSILDIRGDRSMWDQLRRRGRVA